MRKSGKPPSRRALLSRRYLAVCGLSLVALAPGALATDYTWTGNGFASNWNDVNNWNPNGVPDLTSVVTFPDISGQIAITNVSATDFLSKSITIDFTNTFNLSRTTSATELYINNGDLTRTSASAGSHSIEVPVFLGGNGNWTINGSGYLSVGSIDESTAGLNFNKNGTGTLYLGTGSYTGTTNINAGTLLVGSNGLGAGAVTVLSGATLGPDSGASVGHAISINGTGVGNVGALSSPTGTTAWSGAITLSTNSSIGVTSGTMTISGLIDDGALTRTLTKVGAGMLVLSHANTYKGATTVSAGILTLNNAQAAGNTDITVASGASLQAGAGLTINNAVFLNGSGVGGDGALQNQGGSATWDGNIALQSNAAIGSASDELVITGSIGGAFNLSKVGAGTVTLAASNGFGGTLTVSEGTLKVRNPSAPASSGSIVSAGTTLAVQETIANAAITVSRPLSLNGSGVSSGGALRNISSNNTWSGPITLQSNSSVGVDADQLTISGAISGAFNLTKVGPGTLTLTNSSNSYSNTVINGGFLLISNVAALPAGGNVIVHDGGTLRFQNGLTGNRQLFLNGQGQGGAGAIDSFTGANQWTSPIVLQSDSAVAVDADELRITAGVGGSGGLIKIGAGKLSLLNGNTFAGSTQVNRGVLSLEHSLAIPAATTATVADGAALELRSGIAPAASLNLSGTGILNSGALRNTAGTNTWSGPITLKSADVAIGADSGTQLTISGVISDGSDVFPLTKVGTGTLVLSAANTYDSTFINGGTLSISNNNHLGSLSGSLTANNGAKLLVTASTSTSRTFNLTTGSIEAASGVVVNYTNATVNGGFLRGPGTHAIGAGSIFSGVTALNGSFITQNAAATLTNFINSGSIVNGAPLNWDGGYNTAAGSIAVNSNLATNAFENTGNITINSGGVLNNTTSPLVSGGGSRITINSGGNLNVVTTALELNGALLVNNGAITGPTNVNFGSLAKGSGVYGAVNVTDGGKFSPGNSPGAVTTGSTTWNSGGSYVVELDNAVGDFWLVNGLLDVKSTSGHPFTISLLSLEALIFDNTRDYTWPILHAEGGIEGLDFSSIALDLSEFKNNPGSGHFSLQSNSNDLAVHFSAVPEPSALAAIAVAFNGCVRRERRNRWERKIAN